MEKASAVYTWNTLCSLGYGDSTNTPSAAFLCFVTSFIYDMVVKTEEEWKKSCFCKVLNNRSSTFLLCVSALSEAAEVPFNACTRLELGTQTCPSLAIFFLFLFFNLVGLTRMTCSSKLIFLPLCPPFK